MRHAFIQRFSVKRNSIGAEEERRVDGSGPQRMRVDSALVRSRGARWLLVKQATGIALRWSARAVYVSPLWVLAQVALPLSLRGLPIVGFVFTVCLFAAALNLYAWAAGIHWLLARRQQVARPFDDDTHWPAALQRIVGTVAALAPRPSDASSLLREAWDPSTPMRLSVADDFVVVPDDDEPPVVVRLEAMPYVLGAARRARVADESWLAELDAGLSDDAMVEVVEFGPGDRVEIVAGTIDELTRLDHIELGSSVRRYEPSDRAHAPYRGSVERGRLVASGPSNRLYVRILQTHRTLEAARSGAQRESQP